LGGSGKVIPRRLSFERLEGRLLLAGDSAPTSPWHNATRPADVDNDGRVGSSDLLQIVRSLHLRWTEPITSSGEGERQTTFIYPDVNGDWRVSSMDVLLVVRTLVAEGAPPDPPDAAFQLKEAEVELMLERAAAASASEDAIIAIVDREGRLLGVRAEQNVVDVYAGQTEQLVFAVDGAVAKARTAAFFSSNSAPLPSRTVRFISQSTITQREVESNPNVADVSSTARGPGWVAPIGVGGHFPPEVSFTPQVDLLLIEHQSRDSTLHPGVDGIKGTVDDIMLAHRFNVPAFNPGKELAFPESFGFQSGLFPTAQSRGIATLPGGLPIYRSTAEGRKLIGGIGVFFPGSDGYATHEQNFVKTPAGGTPQRELDRNNAPRVLESEWIALAAIGQTAGLKTHVFEIPGSPRPGDLFFPVGRIDLVGITLESIGPHPTAENRTPGLERIIQVGRSVGVGDPDSGDNLQVMPGGDTLIDGQGVPDGWLVGPKDSSTPGGLTKADVERIVQQGIDEANEVRAAIRLTADLRPGERTRMVFAVTDNDGDVLGLFRMPDATVFSIDVAVAKARNVSYYADPTALVTADQVIDDDLVVDTNNDSVNDSDRVPAGTAFTSRTFRFLAEPRYPTGADGPTNLDGVGPFSMLTNVGIDFRTAENVGAPLPASVYMDASIASVVAFDAFRASRNFRDPDKIANQNGVVFFPGSTALYKAGVLVGGVGVSGDGVDQDDVVTVGAQLGFDPPPELRSDMIRFRDVRLPFEKFLRNPLG
jgi:uncharacterized protein GlcG (DUF336 family)